MCIRKKEQDRQRRIEKRSRLLFFTSSSAFQPFSVGLGFRAFPALGGFAHQFEP